MVADSGAVWDRVSHLGAAETAQVRYAARPQAMAVHRVTAQEYPHYWAEVLYYWPGYQMELELAGDRQFRIFHLTPLG